MFGLQKLARNKVPIQQIGAPPVAPLIGGEQIVVIAKWNNDRVSRRSMFAVLHEVWDRAISVVDVDRIAVGRRFFAMAEESERGEQENGMG